MYTKANSIEQSNSTHQQGCDEYNSCWQVLHAGFQVNMILMKFKCIF